jgi:hypothetical protein
MAFTQLTTDVENITALANLPNDDNGLTATQLKAKFDKAGVDIKNYINDTLISELEAQGASAKLGALVGGAASTLQAFINLVESAGTGSLPPDDSITLAKQNSTVKTGLLADLTTSAKTSLVNAINELVTAISNILTPAEILTTEGDMMYRNATLPARLAKGAAGTLMRMNNGATAPEWMALGTAYQALVMNSGATGFQWLSSLQSLLTSTGDMIYASGANSPARLAKVDNKILSSIAGTIGWTSVGAKGTYSDTSTSITSGTPYIASIALGITPTKGRIVLAGNGTNDGGIFMFTTTASDAKSVNIRSGGVADIGYNTALSQSGAFGTNITLYSAYIDGTNLKLEFRCSSGTNTLRVSSGLWEVEI